MSGYEVSWSPETSDADQPVRLNPQTTEYTIPEIEAEVRYTFIAKAIFENGTESVDSAEHRFNVPREPDAKIKSFTHAQITVAWKPPKSDTGVIQRPVNDYILSWRKKVDGAPNYRATLSAETVEFTIAELDAETTYEVDLAGRNPLGDSSLFATDVTTKADPNPPTPTPTSTNTPTATPTPTPTSTNTPTATSTHTPTPTPTDTPTPTPTPTFSPTPTPPPLTVEFKELTQAKGARIRWTLNDSVSSTLSGYEVSWSPPTSKDVELPVMLMPTVTEYTVPDRNECPLHVYGKGGFREWDRSGR